MLAPMIFFKKSAIALLFVGMAMESIRDTGYSSRVEELEHRSVFVATTTSISKKGPEACTDQLVPP